MSEYSIARRYAQLLEISEQRTLTDRETRVLAILRQCVEKYEHEEEEAAPSRRRKSSAA